MKGYLFGALMMVGSLAMAGDAMHETMNKDCAPLFAPGGACADLIKGTRNCVKANAESGGESCVAFVKANAEFIDAGKNDPTVHK